MVQQATVRQPDETICLRCGTVVKRDVGLCPECGTRIAAGPQQAAPATPGLASAKMYSPASEDVAGWGRYLLNFVLAGLIGLGLTFLLRRRGWLATWISIPIGVLAVWLVISTAGSSP